MRAYDLIRDIRWLPMSTEKPCTQASNSEIKRWFKKKSIIINDIVVKIDDIIEMPVVSLVFFPKSKRRCTMV